MKLININSNKITFSVSFSREKKDDLNCRYDFEREGKKWYHTNTDDKYYEEEIDVIKEMLQKLNDNKINTLFNNKIKIKNKIIRE